MNDDSTPEDVLDRLVRRMAGDFYDRIGGVGGHDPRIVRALRERWEASHERR